MTSARTRKTTRPLSLKDAFETEYARRELERRAREDAERRQQEADLAGAAELFAALSRSPKFLKDHGLTADQRRYTVALDHEKFRIATYFEGGLATVTVSDKRNLTPGAATPRMQESAGSVEDALGLIARILADEFR